MYIYFGKEKQDATEEEPKAGADAVVRPNSLKKLTITIISNTENTNNNDNNDNNDNGTHRHDNDDTNNNNNHNTHTTTIGG